MKLLFAAIFVIIAIFFLTRRRRPVADAAFSPLAGPPAGGAAISPAEMDEMNRTARARRGAALSSRWWNC